jgi:prophage antirepressor-like protein
MTAKAESAYLAALPGNCHCFASALVLMQCVYTSPVTPAIGVAGIGLPFVSAARSRSRRKSCGFHLSGPIFGGSNVGAQARLLAASAGTQVDQPVRAAASIGLDTAASKLSLSEAIVATILSGASAQITPFSFNTHSVRVVLRGGNPWFVAADVCAALDYSNPSDAVATHLDADEKMTIANGDSHSGKRGGARLMTIISESGLYALVLRSRKPEARKFAKWVTAEVLPSIRKTGRYEAPAAKKPMPRPQVCASYRRVIEILDDTRKLQRAAALVGNEILSRNLGAIATRLDALGMHEPDLPDAWWDRKRVGA